MCRNPETTLTRDSVTRLYFLQCEACNSRRSGTVPSRFRLELFEVPLLRQIRSELILMVICSCTDQERFPRHYAR